MKIDNNLSHY